MPSAGVAWEIALQPAFLSDGKETSALTPGVGTLPWESSSCRGRRKEHTWRI